MGGLTAGTRTAPAPVEVTARDVTIAYRGASGPAVTGISVEVAAGTCLLIVGPSGSGKSTLARAMAGLVPWSVPARLDGELSLDGLPVGSADPVAMAARVGVVFQDPASQLVMERVEDDVAFGLEGRGWPRDRMRARVPVALAEAGLAGFDLRRTARLSGGEQQRLALAGAFAPQPGLLVLDEPTANLDPGGAIAFAERLAALHAGRTTTIVLVEHRADLAWPLADLVLALDGGGHPIALGPPAEVLAAHTGDLAAAGIWLPTDEPPPLPAPGARREGRDGPGVSGEGVAPGALGGAVSPGPAGEEAAPPGAAGVGAAPPGAAGAAGVPLLDLREVAFAWARGGPAILRDAWIGIAPGERVALLGPNGSGKSTLARLAVGLLRPSAGTVRLAGRDPARLPAHDLARLAGYVMQDPERGFLAPTVAAEIGLGLDPGERPRVADIAEDLGLPLGRFGERNPFTLSGGEQRRLSLATQLVRRPALLVLDEPTFGQDRRGYQALLGILRDRIAAGTALLSVTHDLRFAAEMADRVLHMDSGAPVSGIEDAAPRGDGMPEGAWAVAAAAAGPVASADGAAGGAPA